MDGAFDIMPATFGMVLVLVLMGFTLPVGNDKGAQNIMSSFADLISTAVTDKFIHGTTFTNDVFKGIDEFLGTVHRKDVNDVWVVTDKDLGTSVTIDSGDLGYDGVGSDRFTTAKNV